MKQANWLWIVGLYSLGLAMFGFAGLMADEAVREHDRMLFLLYVLTVPVWAIFGIWLIGASWALTWKDEGGAE